MDGTAVRGVRSFFMELAESLDVIRPAPARRYIFDKNLVLEQVALSEFRSDARRCQVRHQEVIEHLHMKCMARTGRAVVLSKNFVNETERLERRLEQAGIAYEREAIRIADGDKLTEVRYAFVADVTLNVHVDCDNAMPACCASRCATSTGLRQSGARSRRTRSLKLDWTISDAGGWGSRTSFLRERKSCGASKRADSAKGSRVVRSRARGVAGSLRTRHVVTFVTIC